MLLIVCRLMVFMGRNNHHMKDARLSQFGARVKRLRERSGLSQEELAAKVGIHRTYIGSVERGERNLGLINVLRIADALSVAPALLFKEFGRRS